MSCNNSSWGDRVVSISHRNRAGITMCTVRVAAIILGRPRPKVTILPSGYMLQKIWGAFVTSFNADQWELRIKSRDRPPLVVASY